MARLISSTYAPITSLVHQTILNDGTTIDRLFELDDIESVRYAENQAIHSVTGRVTDFTVRNLNAKRSYNKLVSAKSYFADDVIPVSIVVDSSTENHSKVTTIPTKEILEDEGQENVKRMRCFMKYAVKFNLLLSNGAEEEFILHEGDDVTDLIYMKNGDDADISGRVVAFRYNVDLIPSAVIIRSENELEEIPVMAIKGCGVTNPPVSSSSFNGTLNEVLKHNPELNISAGEVTDAITVENNVRICGANAGISGAARYREYMITKNETVFSGAINVAKGGSLELDGLFITLDARIYASEAKSVVLRNCIFESVVGTGDNAFLVQTAGNEAMHLCINDCYFGENRGEDEKPIFKNLFELNAPMDDSSNILSNYFAKGICRNNIIAIYNVADGTEEEPTNIYVNFNHFEYSANAVRVGVVNEPKFVEIQMADNSYDATSEDDYAGFLLVQPYGKKTVSMVGVTIELSKLKNKSGNTQYAYAYIGANDTDLRPDKFPKLIVDSIPTELIIAP